MLLAKGEQLSTDRSRRRRLQGRGRSWMRARPAFRTFLSSTTRLRVVLSEKTMREKPWFQHRW